MYWNKVFISNSNKTLKSLLSVTYPKWPNLVNTKLKLGIISGDDRKRYWKMFMGGLTTSIMFYYFFKNLKGQTKSKNCFNQTKGQQCKHYQVLIDLGVHTKRFIILSSFLCAFQNILLYQNNDSRKSIKSRVYIFQYIIEILVFKYEICKEDY